jgi:hypothetical protein
MSTGSGNGVEVSRSSYLKGQIDGAIKFHQRNSKGVIRDVDDDYEEREDMMEQEKLSDVSQNSTPHAGMMKESEMVAIPVVGNLSNGNIRKRS